MFIDLYYEIMFTESKEEKITWKERKTEKKKERKRQQYLYKEDGKDGENEELIG